MALAPSRVSYLAIRAFLINQQFHSLTHNTPLSPSNPPLVSRLIQEPISRIKSTLDSLENNALFKSSDFSWDSFVTTLCSSSPQKAQLVVEWRLEKLVKENKTNQDYFSELIYLCGKIKNIRIAMQAFASMEEHGIKPTPAVFNALISTCLSSHNFITALSVFETMTFSHDYKPNPDTYNTFISAYAKMGNNNAMQAWYLAKKSSGFSPNLHTYEALICGSIKLKNYGDANKYYEEMKSVGIKPNIPILQSNLAALCELRNLSDVKEFLKFILDEKWEINVYMIDKLMGFLHELGKVEEMEEVLMNLTKSNQVFEVLYRAHIAIIKTYAILDRLNDVEYAVGRMLKEGISFGCDDDVEKVICMYFRTGAYNRLELFLERIKGIYKFGRSTYDLLVAGYRRAGLYEKVDIVVNEMKMNGVL